MFYKNKGKGRGREGQERKERKKKREINLCQQIIRYWGKSLILLLWYNVKGHIKIFNEKAKVVQRHKKLSLTVGVVQL